MKKHRFAKSYLFLALTLLFFIFLSFFQTGNYIFSQDIREIYMPIGVEDFSIGISCDEWNSLMHERFIYPAEQDFIYARKIINPYIMMHNRYNYDFNGDYLVFPHESTLSNQIPETNGEILFQFHNLPIDEENYIFLQDTNDNYLIIYNEIKEYSVDADSLYRINDLITGLNFCFFEETLYEIQAEITVDLEELISLIYHYKELYGNGRVISPLPMQLVQFDFDPVNTNPLYIEWNTESGISLRLEISHELIQLLGIDTDAIDENTDPLSIVQSDLMPYYYSHGGFDGHSVRIIASDNAAVNEIAEHQSQVESTLLLELLRVVRNEQRLIDGYLYDRETMSNWNTNERNLFYQNDNVNDL